MNIGFLAALLATVFSCAIILVLGLLSLKSSQNLIGDPFFPILELLILLTAPLMVICKVAIHDYASPNTVRLSFQSHSLLTKFQGFQLSNAESIGLIEWYRDETH